MSRDNHNQAALKNNGRAMRIASGAMKDSKNRFGPVTGIPSIIMKLVATKGEFQAPL